MNFFKHTLSLFIFIILFASFAHTQELKPLPPVPTDDQLAWQKLEYIAFAHFGINTFTDREWGDGTEDPNLFNPAEFDAKQWVRVLKDAGMKLLILTCKHHDGFCLWPSEYTEHSVKNSPWKNGQGDIVKEVSNACHEAGIKFGVYLSPWDRHEPSYGNSPVYNEYFKNQLRELLTNYGEIAEVWFDGAYGEGPNGRRQVYDFPGYYEVVRELQPNAVIAIVGPDVRWVGNESGVARETEWSVQVIAPETNAQAHTGFNPAKYNKTKVTGDLRYVTDLNLDKGPMIWYPAECDVSIRPGWFYHASQDDDVKTLDHLEDIYYKSIGRNSVLLLNLPPDRRGLIHENDAQRLRELRALIDATFDVDLAQNSKAFATKKRIGYPASNILDGDETTYWAANEGDEQATIVVELEQPKLFDVVEIREPISLGQRIAGFKVDALVDNEWKQITSGTTVGYKRLLRTDPVKTTKIRVSITKSRAFPIIHSIGLYKKPPVVSIHAEETKFIDSETITLSCDIESKKIYYTLDGSDPNTNANVYDKPITIDETITLKAIAEDGVRIAQQTFKKLEFREPHLGANLFPGVNYRYYEGGWQSLHDLPKKEPQKHGWSENFNLKDREQEEHVAFQFQGLVNVPKKGLYTFYIESDDGSQLYIGDTLLIDNDGLHGMIEMKGTVALQAGLHPITVNYFNATGDKGLKVSYSGPSVEKQEIPKEALRRVNLGQ